MAEAALKLDDYRQRIGGRRAAPAVWDRSTIGLRQYSEQKLGALKTQAYGWRMHWQDLAAYILPRKYRYLVTASNAWKGNRRNERIIDSTTTMALRTMAAGMMGGITSPARPWFKLSMQDPDLAKFPPVKLWLEDSTERMQRVAAKSNFYGACHSMYRDLGCFGTAPIIIYEDPYKVMHCYRPTMGEFFVAQDDRQEVDTLVREFTQTSRQLVQKFGENRVSENVRLAYKQPTNADQDRIVGCLIEPNDTRVIGAPGAKGMAYRDLYWEQGSSQDQMLRERGYHERPFACPRWDVSDNDAYGDSPGMDALGDAMQLQVEQRRRAEAIEKMVRPPLVADIALKNQPSANVPGGITYVPGVDKVGMKPVYEVMPELQHMVTDIREVQARIKEMFFYDLFLMISQLDTVRTATEIIARKEEKLVMLGPVLDRFHNEALDPIVMRMFAICYRAGVFLPPPDAMRGQLMTVEYTSMLSEAQKAINTAPIERVWGFAASIAQSGQVQVFDNLDADGSIRQYSDLLGASEKIMQPVQITAAIRQQRAKKQQEAETLQLTAAAVKGVSELSKINVGAGAQAAGATA